MRLIHLASSIVSLAVHLLRHLSRPASSAIVGGLLLAGSAVAAPDTTDRIHVEMPAQSLSDALIEIGTRTGVAIAFSNQELENLEAPRISGNYTVKELLDLVLGQANLEYEFIDTNTVRILRAPPTPVPAMPQTAVTRAARPVVTAAQPPEQQIEQTIVIGFRGSLARALDIKRSALGVQDSIVAEDIQDFPDLNLAEALQRIPGVTITRDAGEGRQIALRGLGSDFVRTQVNGMEALFTSASGVDPRGGASRTRSFDYSVFASELFDRVDVHKSWSVDLDEGGIGGTVSLVTPKPFDYDGFKAVISTKASQNSRADEPNPRMAGIVSNTWGNVGALISAAWSKADTVEFGTRLFAWTPIEIAPANIDVDLASSLNQATYDRLTNAGDAYADLDKFFHPEGMVLQTWANDRERLGLTGALQFKPSDRTDITLDVLYGEISNRREGAALATTGVNEIWREVNGTQVLKSITIEGDDVMAASWDGVDMRVEGNIGADETKFYQAVLGGTWQGSDRLTFRGTLGYAKSDYQLLALEKVYLENKSQPIAFDFDRPDLRADGIAGVIDYRFDLTDPAGWNLYRASTGATGIDNEFKTAKLDAIFDFGGSKAQFGAMYKMFENVGNNLGLTTSYDSTDPGIPATVKTTLGLPSLFPYVIPEVDATLQGIGFIRARDLGTEHSQAGADYTVEEDTYSLYAMYSVDTYLGGVPFQASVGLRYVATDVTSDGWANLGGGVIERVTLTSDYDYLLPAFNLVWGLSDNVVLRATADRNISRPTLSDMRAAGNVSPRQSGGSINAGNPGLAPFRADSLNLSLEYYYGRGHYVSVGAFHKDMASFIVTETQLIPYGQTGYPLEFLAPTPLNTADSIFDVSRPVNGQGATIKGFELAVHQTFDFLPDAWSNLGVIANATYADGKTVYNISGWDWTLPLYQLSKWTGNATLYYETSRWGVRASWAYRDKYLVGGGTENNIAEGRLATRNIDAAAFWNVTPNLRASLEATDLTEEPIDQFFDVFHERTGALTRAGRNLILGATYQF